ncbi:MAG: TonB family protein [Gemmatimonadota bacterium]|nr:TonB family protein [Gemmatimonadota bacterium]
MRTALFISLATHILLLGSLWKFGWTQVSVIKIPHVVQVRLISIPEVQEAPPEETVPEVDVETIPPPPEEKKKLKPKPKEAEPRKKPKREEKVLSDADASLAGMRSDELFEFPYYLRQMIDKIRRNWRNPYSDEALCTIYFRITRDGRIQGARVEKLSGRSSFDRAALRAVVNSRFFSPLPDDYAESQLTVHLDFKSLGN